MHPLGFSHIQNKDWLDVGVEKFDFGFQCQVLGLSDILKMEENSSGFVYSSTLI